MTILSNIGEQMNNLYYSEKDNFFNKIKDYISNSNRELIIISPYIQINALDNLLSNCKAKVTIITTWKLRDIQLGTSELELYNYCKEKNIFLYLNQRVHLKTFINDYSSCLFGSANITFKGLALVENYNYELITKVEKLNIDSILYFKQILNESVLVNNEVYEMYKEKINELEDLPDTEEPNLIDIESRSKFLISALPMSWDIDELFQLYSSGFKTESKEKINCAIHDIVLYQIPLNLNYNDFKELLNERFFISPFVIKLLDFIDGEPRYFGRVKEWIQNNCEDVPVPSRRDLTGNIQVLYNWIVDLSNGKYQVDRPNYSERIYRVR
ncbi:hypothetical protein DU86_11230 [Methanosarcina mazei]|uniref:Phospholipase D-like domain-containing protein n=3 Tax=Methanosarcina mazei TaxID=2209 RepID=A0A0F8SWI6_METMZ|nr:phospholipase D family protein [Methanosarcina mazei]KKF99583.1 hypothetical protein DU31_10205 [Methanosarcina mazei]KKH34845.1 hypothetical protein DU54_10155 [Methanosarcina mazei]KKH39160.1 hypothetical protein DU50_11160 [Methanosarcina mazei]KKH50758.1 hypothetical protein DU85_06855 [Methanosarcina mazei]KKH54352.1 hypothetical protein DU76_16760 [Methanosarcina mazei]